MENSQKAKSPLPLMFTLRQSFMFPVKNFRAFVSLCLGWYILIMVYEALTGFPMVYSLQDGEDTLRGVVSGMLMLFANISVLVGGCRMALEKYQPRPGYIYFRKRELRILGYSLLLGFSFICAAALLLMAFGWSMEFVGIEYNEWFSWGMVLLLCYVLFLPLVRFYLIYPARAVNNREMSLIKSFKLTKGNANKLAVGFILASLPFFVFALLTEAGIAAVSPQGFFANLLCCFFLLTSSLGDSILLSAYYARIYQYFAPADQNAA